MNVWTFGFRAVMFRPRDYLMAVGFFTLFVLVPAVDAVLLGRAFDAIEAGQDSTVYLLAGVMLITAALNLAAIYVAAIYFTRSLWLIESMLRSNLLAAQTASGGADAGPPAESAGEAITHFRDDPEDIGQFVDAWIDVFASAVFVATAIGILGGINVRATVGLIVPMVAVLLVTFALDRRIKEYRALDRQASVAVTGSLGDVFGASTAITVNGATRSTLGHLEKLFAARKRTAVRDRVLEDGLLAFARGASEYSLGLTMIVAAGAIASGAFDAGDFATFVMLLLFLGLLPRMVGRMLARAKQSEVAIQGMRTLVAQEQKLVEHRFLPFENPEQFPDRTLPPRQDLVRLTVTELAVSRNGSPVVGPISFDVEPGTLTVVTGTVGSGKSTLLRAVVGLVDGEHVTGEVFWNGRRIEDRAAFFTPPQAAYLPQVPNLISDSLLANVLLGVGDRSALDRSLEMVSLAHDVDQMDAGVETLVGPRGLRLSGGQRQRVAAARALVHRPGLIVLDDLSSALDVETELELWSNLANAGVTVLAVSHRQVAIDRAHRVIELG